MNTEPFKVKAYSKKELTALYHVTPVTFRKWLSKVNDLGDYIGQKFTPSQVQKIVNHIGTP